MKTHFSLVRVDVDVDIFRTDLQQKKDDREPAGEEPLSVALCDALFHDPAFHYAAVHEVHLLSPCRSRERRS